MPNKKYYSKLHIKGLPTPKEIVIRNLADYVKLLSSGKLENYIYRGEPTNYNNIISSALRDGEYERQLVFEDGTEIPVEEIFSLDIVGLGKQLSQKGISLTRNT